MDVYGPTPPDLFRVDDLLDFSNDELFSPNSTTDSVTDDHLLQQPHTHISGNTSTSSSTTTTTGSAYFDATHRNFPSTDELSIPSDDVAELEWLSTFVDDSFNDYPANSSAGIVNFTSETAFQVGSKTKRTRSAITNPRRRESSVSTSGRDRSAAVEVARRCTHCASEKTPQWRTGPLGPKTLCNACGVRYKSGRLVPEYRPAASPTFVLTQHSNSHRKVLELRRQKEMLLQQQQQQEQHKYGLHHFQVC